MGRAGSRFCRLARVRHHSRWAAPTGRPAPYPARPTHPTPPIELTTERRNRSHTNRIRRHRITSQAAGPTSSQIYTGNGTPPVEVSPDLIAGDVDEGYGKVADVFRRNLTSGQEVGAAVAVYRDGVKVVDLWGGFRNGITKAPWAEDTLVPTFSTTKGCVRARGGRRRLAGTDLL